MLCRNSNADGNKRHSCSRFSTAKAISLSERFKLSYKFGKLRWHATIELQSTEETCFHQMKSSITTPFLTNYVSIKVKNPWKAPGPTDEHFDMIPLVRAWHVRSGSKTKLETYQMHTINPNCVTHTGKIKIRNQLIAQKHTGWKNSVDEFKSACASLGHSESRPPTRGDS